MSETYDPKTTPEELRKYIRNWTYPSIHRDQLLPLLDDLAARDRRIGELEKDRSIDAEAFVALNAVCDAYEIEVDDSYAKGFRAKLDALTARLRAAEEEADAARTYEERKAALAAAEDRLAAIYSREEGHAEAEKAVELADAWREAALDRLVRARARRDALGSQPDARGGDK